MMHHPILWYAWQEIWRTLTLHAALLGMSVPSFSGLKAQSRMMPNSGAARATGRAVDIDTGAARSACRCRTTGSNQSKYMLRLLTVAGCDINEV
jgi:hypothetical protein